MKRKCFYPYASSRYSNTILHRNLQLEPTVFSPEKAQRAMLLRKGYDTPCSNAVPRLIRNRNAPLIKGNFSGKPISISMLMSICTAAFTKAASKAGFLQ